MSRLFLFFFLDMVRPCGTLVLTEAEDGAMLGSNRKTVRNALIFQMPLLFDF